jgi:hypothetical protein
MSHCSCHEISRVKTLDSRGRDLSDGVSAQPERPRSRGLPASARAQPGSMSAAGRPRQPASPLLRRESGDGGLDGPRRARCVPRRRRTTEPCRAAAVGARAASGAAAAPSGELAGGQSWEAASVRNRRHSLYGRRCGPGWTEPPVHVSRAFPSWNWSIWTDIYLCHACSDHVREDGHARTGCARQWRTRQSSHAAPTARHPCNTGRSYGGGTAR